MTYGSPGPSSRVAHLLSRAVVLLCLGLFFFFSISVVLYAATTGEIQTTVKIAVCGNNVKEGGEECDNADLGGATCSSIGYDGGTLSCTPACEYDVQQCTGELDDGSSDSGDETGGSSGGGSVSNVNPTAINFSGTAYPNARVIILKDSTVFAETTANIHGQYDVFVSDISSGIQTFSIQAEGTFGNYSVTENITVDIQSEETALISGTVLSPTIGINTTSQQQSSPIIFHGSSAPAAQITIGIEGPRDSIRVTQSNLAGAWTAQLSARDFPNGVYTATAAFIKNGVKSKISYPVLFVINDEGFEILSDEGGFERADMNNDGRVNLIDFSILTYWHGKNNVPKEVDFIEDGVVNLRDYSFLAYYWTG